MPCPANRCRRSRAPLPLSLSNTCQSQSSPSLSSQEHKDLPKLVEGLRRITVEDPNLIVKINGDGETLMAGMGVLHLEIATSLLQELGLDIVTTQPLINFTARPSAQAPGPS